MQELDMHKLEVQELEMQELVIVTQEVDNEHQLELLDDELLVGLAGEATSSTSAASS